MALNITGPIIVQRSEHGNRRPRALYAMALEEGYLSSEVAHLVCQPCEPSGAESIVKLVDLGKSDTCFFVGDLVRSP